MNLENKHIFIIRDTDKFFLLQADALIEKVGIKKENIIAIVIDNGNFKNLKKLDGVTYIKYNKNLDKNILKSKTITSISLSSFNSWLINSLIKQSEEVLKKYFIYLTDDEVDRWRQNYEKNGKLKVDMSKYISNDDLEVLKRVKNMIGIENVFQPIITKILKREINFIDAALIFDILKVEKQKKLNACLIKGREEQEQELKLLYGSKGITFKSIVEIFKIINRVKVKKLSFRVFGNHPINIILLELIRIYYYVIKKRKINIDYLNPMSPLDYITIVSSCNYFILQDRGGVSTARTYLKLNSGKLCIKEKSYNYDCLKKGYKTDFISYTTTNELAKLILKNEIDLNKNRMKIIEIEKKWIEKYKILYK